MPSDEKEVFVDEETYSRMLCEIANYTSETTSELVLFEITEILRKETGIKLTVLPDTSGAEKK